MAPPSASDKWRFTLYTTFVLVLLFNSWTFSVVNTLLSRFIGQTATGNGCPTVLGFVVHTVIFTLIIRYIMDLHL
jgi:hypothetical protein